jgi:hypothetical protein
LSTCRRRTAAPEFFGDDVGVPFGDDVGVPFGDDAGAGVVLLPPGEVAGIGENVGSRSVRFSSGLHSTLIDTSQVNNSLGGALGSGVGGGVGAGVGPGVGGGVGAGVGPGVGGGVGAGVGGGVGNGLGGVVGNGVGGGVGTGVGGGVGTGVGGGVGTGVGEGVGTGVGGGVGCGVGSGEGGGEGETDGEGVGAMVVENWYSAVAKHGTPEGGFASTSTVVRYVPSTQALISSVSVAEVHSVGLRAVTGRSIRKSTVTPPRVLSATVMSIRVVPMLQSS